MKPRSLVLGSWSLSPVSHCVKPFSKRVKDRTSGRKGIYISLETTQALQHPAWGTYTGGILIAFLKLLRFQCNRHLKWKYMRFLIELLQVRHKKAHVIANFGTCAEETVSRRVDLTIISFLFLPQNSARTRGLPLNWEGWTVLKRASHEVRRKVDACLREC